VVLERLEHREDGVAVQLQLGPLVGVDGVVDGERVQLQLVDDEVELLVRGFEQADPQEAVAARLGPLERLADVAVDLLARAPDRWPCPRSR
jgi:hypothetical protein